MHSKPTLKNSKRLEASRQRNVICQSKLDDAYKASETDGEKLKELMDGQTILKGELSRSKTMLEVYRIFMEQQQRQRIDLKHEGDSETTELANRQTAHLDKMKLHYQQQHRRSQERIKQMEQASMKCNAEFVKARSMLKELNPFMKDQLSYLDADEETNDSNTSCALQNQTAGNRSIN